MRVKPIKSKLSGANGEQAVDVRARQVLSCALSITKSEEFGTTSFVSFGAALGGDNGSFCCFWERIR